MGARPRARSASQLRRVPPIKSPKHHCLCLRTKMAPAPGAAPGLHGSKPCSLLLQQTGMKMAGVGGAAPPPAGSEPAALLLHKTQDGKWLPRVVTLHHRSFDRALTVRCIACLPLGNECWCRQEGLHLHVLRRQFLRLLCMLFHHAGKSWFSVRDSLPRRAVCKTAVLAAFDRAKFDHGSQSSEPRAGT